MTEHLSTEEIKNKIRKSIKVKKVKSETGDIFLLMVGKTKIRPYLTKKEACDSDRFLRKAVIEIFDI